ncbi:putative acyl-CoA ligase [Marmoricola endophyticus]|uniref:Acyl-CoA ligase n=1 Tax=Marmoricola endophyticus TaxID=2040280 RepID=A0A917FAC4_9ACTN|nr:acyl-CoA synthetase [Marmoricola endophyticus]GGF57379.1 putative acyl-CoA ligase [Marmoricola endophyticus]
MYPGTWARTDPDKPALVMAGSGRTTTYAELDERSLRLAHVLADAGLRAGDVVAMVSDNQPEAFEVYWAAMRSGLYVTAVNHHLSVGEAAYVLADCGAKALVVSAAKSELARDLLDHGVPERRLVFGGSVEGYDDYAAALAGAGTAPLAEQPHGDDLLYSSGTTGRPKGIKQPLPAIAVDEPGYSYVTIFGGLFGYGPETVYLNPAPVYHAAPLRFMGTVQALGGTVVMMERFEPAAFLDAVQRFAVTDTQVVPTMFVRLLKLPEEVRRGYDTSSLRTVVHAAAPCPVEVKQAMIDWLGPVVHEYYASTEANGATYVGPQDWLAHPGTVGRPLMGTPHVCGPDGAELGTDEVGTVYFEPDEGRVPFEYHADPERTAATRHPDHPSWSTVGDLGRLDADGWLFLTDRAAFMIISGGVNIYPQEIEDLFSLHPEVLDVAVIGVPDDEMGERVVAYVQPADGVSRDGLADRLREYARERIARFKVPAEFLLVDDLPRTPTGKLVKGRLRDRYQAEAGQGVVR